ncbi:DUF1178 family protein [Algirhabdus cladophorae]|uniref:DUF1178 family protein n=1 Tax=Algirhabdus cladophorae TaxID=3377108 RepID=UPI003B84A3AB
MIKYKLKCGNDHQFESWFQSSAAYETLFQAGHVSCATCGSTDISKALMAPSVTPKRAQNLDTSPNEADLKALKEHVESTSEYVGQDFVKEARAIHDGDSDKTAIYGEAKLEEAKKLLDDGIPVAPLPFVPNRKVN